MRTLNNSLLNLHGQMQHADATSARTLRSQAATVITQRSAALTKLIQNDPHAALSFALSPELVADLAAKFPNAAAQLEQHVTVTGPVELLVMDNSDHTSRSSIKMNNGGRTLSLYFAGQLPKNLKTGAVLQASGVAVAYQLAVSSSNTTQISATTTTSGASSTNMCSTKGPQNTAVFLASYSGASHPLTITTQSLQDVFFGTGRSLDGFWKEASYGQTSATGDVFAFNLPNTYTCSNIDQMRDDVIAAATAAGINVQNYSRIVLVIPDALGCGWAGMSSVGCTTLNSSAGSWTASYGYLDSYYLALSTDRAVELTTHELGHSLGLQHARSRAFGAEPLGPLGAVGTVYEYGDSFNTMGYWSLAQYSAPHKAEELGWIAPTSNYQVVQSTGTYTLEPFETSSAGVKALKIQRGSGNSAWLWLEYRQPSGNYDTALSQWLPPSAMVHYEDSLTYSGYTDLLNFTPTDTSFSTPQLLNGQSWVDTYSNLSLSVTGANSSGLTVNVNYGSSSTCQQANPSIVVTPLDPSIYPGGTAAYGLTLTNNDSSACGANTFAMNSTQPGGWPSSFASNSITLNPGQSVSVTMYKTGPSGTPAGTYAVDANASSGSHSVAGMANVTVMAAPSVTVAVSVPAATYTRKNTVPIAATVLSGGVAASGANVVFTLTRPDGTTATQSAVTRSKGTASWSYRLSPQSPTGTYSVLAQATVSSAGGASVQPATSNTVTFNVQ